MEDGKAMIDIIYEDNHLLVVNKPINTPVQADSSKDQDLLTLLKKQLKEKYQKPGNVYLVLVHRLDRPVGGIMVFAKTSKAASRLSEQIRNNTFKKTYLAVVFAVAALKNNEVKKIILTRPAVEAGENLGFLPGDLKGKVDPYLRPLYDALYDMLGVEQTEKLMEKGVIEIAPLAYMRGRTLEDAYVILDEAQNTTDNQMKMFLTRLGFRSKMIVTGDISQIDLPRNTTSGLIRALDILEGVKGISFIHLSAMDVVRHPVVQRIIERYDGNNE